MTPNVPTSDSGTAIAGIAVAPGLRRNRKTTAVTRMTLKISVISTSCTDARMVSVRSTAISVLIAGEIDCSSRGSASLIRSMVSRMFAPGSRRMIMSTARSLLLQAASRLFSTSSNTLATWPSVMPALLA